MLLIPAIDLKDGRCVQLRQGAPASASIYSDDPPRMAGRWVDAGARRLHIVDLDGAFAGEPVHRGIIERIVQAAAGIPVQVGGGIRTIETARAYLDAGVGQVILGTRALEDPSFLRTVATEFPGRAVLGLDARNGRAATRGWTAGDGADVVKFAAGLGDIDLFAIVYTDIGRDGMLTGVDAAATRRMAEAAAVPIIASGGVHDLDDLRTLKELALGADRLLGVISGSALYEGTLDFTAGQKLLDG